jgi:hypothetical protein
MAFNKNMKIYIPLINSFWSQEDKIKEIFQKRNVGEVKKVKIVKKRSTKKETGYVYSAFVELVWFKNENSVELQEKMNAPGVVTDSRVMLDDDWYYLILSSERVMNEKRRR